MKFKIILSFVLITCSVYAQEVLDKIVAVVDNEIILQSELDYQTKYLAAERKLDPNSAGLKKQVLNSMIEEKLIYAQANLDSIEVTDDEVTQRVDYQVQLFIQQYGSREKVEQLYGMSIEKIKRELHDEVRKSIMIQKLKEKKFGNIESTRRDVEEFYHTFKDSLGIIPEKVKIAHIYRQPKATEEIKEKFRKKAEAILDSLKHGANFADMARKYSEDPGSAAQGGDLGFVKKGVFYPQFEAAAFALHPGELSGVVESPVGFHIIEMIEKRGEAIHTRHILIKIKTTDEADLKAIEFLSEIRDSIVKGKETFAYYAKKYSEDPASSPFGGDLGTFYLSQLDKSLLDIVSKLKVGEISFPKRIEFGNGYGYHIVSLESRILQHSADLVTDYDELKKLSDQLKKQKKYEEWISQLKDKIYWKIMI